MGRSNADMREALKSTRTQKPELKEKVDEPIPKVHNQRSASRRGKKMTACYLELDAFRQLKVLCVEKDMYIEDALKEGINMLFSANNKPPIA